MPVLAARYLSNKHEQGILVGTLPYLLYLGRLTQSIATVGEKRIGVETGLADNHLIEGARNMNSVS